MSEALLSEWETAGQNTGARKGRLPDGSALKPTAFSLNLLPVFISSIHQVVKVWDTPNNVQGLF